MKRIVKFVLIIILNFIIFLLTVKITETILQKSEDKVKGTYITRINKESLIFPNTERKLKYFYEPQANFLWSWNPDWLGYKVENTINSDTLNERFEYSVQKPVNNYRIITLGDSSVYGLYIETPFNYPERLEDLLNSKLKCNNDTHFEIINLGVGGYDIEYSVERFLRRGFKYDPDLIIWLVNDWNFKNINEYTLPRQQEYRKEGHKDFDVITKKYLTTEIVFSELSDKYSNNKILDYQKKVIERLLKHYKGKILFISYPSLSAEYKKLIHDFKRKDRDKYDFYDKITDIVSQEELHLLDYHPNIEGYKKISEDVFYYLSEKYFKECNNVN